ncbi:GGDEF domain-containing protein [Methylobacterium organophilum]|uniref:GGDEF domain-containing protein n=1 Tax=Methylobacterium organophilum TaxID=410 RepID=UPI001F12EDFE|nr:GGDEF domain-containing protein [Methylobacterium organophilum]UMY18382.1 GGDEF domain-containing protein [Methylobacterium organophilum]
MPDLPDLATVRLCSMLASAAFVLVYLCLWLGRRSEDYLLYWALTSALYVLTLLGFGLSDHSPLQDGSLYALLAASDLIVLAGVRRFEGRPAFAAWMILPIAATGLGYALPAWIVGPDSAAARIGGTFGTALTMGLSGWLVAFPRRGTVSTGRRIAGLGLLGYLPGYAVAMIEEGTGRALINMVALVPMLSDQILLAVLNLGLLAMPGERDSAKLRDLAHTDALTGAWNRAGLEARAGRLLAGGGAVIVIDVDHFKAINDRHGHAAGDTVLADLVARARIALPPAALMARLGGDEFVAVLPAASLASAHAGAEAIRSAVAGAQGRFAWTVSLGCGEIRPGETGVAEAIARADRSLYRAKAKGRNRVAA